MIVGVTGHRPQNLPLGVFHNGAHAVLCQLAKQALEGIATHVISGVALGWDIAVADTAQALGIPWTAAIPFQGQEALWLESEQSAYRRLLASASRVVEVCEPGFEAWKYQRRNEWIVDHCDAMLALWSGAKGGTGNCLWYASSVGRPIVNAWDEFCVEAEKVRSERP